MKGISEKSLLLALSVTLAPGLAGAADSCALLSDDVQARLEQLSDTVAAQDKGFRDEHAKTTSSDYSKNYFQHFEDLNKNAKEAADLVTTAYDLSGVKPLDLGQMQKALPPKVTHTMSNAVEIAQAALDEENTKLDLVELRCDQSTEDTALSAYLGTVGSSAESNYKSTKKTACKAVQLLADLQDKRDKLNDFRENGYPIFFLHAKDKKGFSGKERTIQLKADLRMYPEYPSSPVNETTLNGQPILLGTLEGIDLSYNSWFKFSDNNWTSLNLFQYIVDDTDQGEVCPTKIKISGSVKAKLCVSVEDIKTDQIRIAVRGKFNYNSDWKAVSLGTHTIPAPFGYLADVSDMKEKKMEDLKDKLANRVASVLGEYGDMVDKAREWKEQCQ